MFAAKERRKASQQGLFGNRKMSDELA